MLSRASLRSRLLIASLTLVLAGLAVADAATYLALRSFLLGQADARLADAAETVDHAVTDEGLIDADDLAAAEEGGLLAPGMYVERRAADGSVMTLSGRAHIRPRLPDPLPLPPVSGAQRDEKAHATFPAPNEAGGADLLVRTHRSGSRGAVVVVALSLDEVNGVLARLVAIETVAMTTVLAAVAAGGTWLVRIALRPLDAIGRAASEIADGDLSRRIERTDDRTEIGRLGRSLNGMLHQIDAAFTEREATAEQLRRSEERLRRFVADASHELRTPLAAIRAYSELLERSAADHPEDVAHHVGPIRHETERMGLLVADLLLLSRLDQGRPLEQEPVDLGLVVAESIDAARAVDPDRMVRLTVEGLVEATGDRARLRQVFDNLLSNARVHTPPGTPIDVTVRADGGRALTQVTDHGPGVEHDQAARVFERFYRVDRSRSRAAPAVPDPGRTPGSGLGLAIVQAVTDAHGGTVAVGATPGGGATFTVTLPLLDPGADDARPEADCVAVHQPAGL